MTFGLSNNGFIKKTQTDIESSMESYIQDNFFPTFKIRRESDTSQDQLLTTMASELAELWEIGEGLYYAYIPSYSQGQQLDNIAEITSCERLSGIKTIVPVTLSGTSGTVVSTSTSFLVSGTSYRFYPLEEVTIPSSGVIDINVIAENYGVIAVSANTLTVIETPILGLASVNNSSAQTILGRDEETDNEFRKRRANLVAFNGSGSPDAIRANLLALENVLDADVYVNKEITTDSEGRPAKSYECIVYGGTDLDIAETIWNVGPGGIESYGTTTQSITDSTGTTQTIKFTRPDVVNIYIDIQLTKNSLFPSDGESQIKESISEYFATNYLIGDDVVRTRLYNLIYSIAGVINVEYIGLDVVATGDGLESDITIGYNEIAYTDTDKINITYI